MSPVRLFLVDDHQIMREGLRLVLTREPGFTVVGEAANGEVALAEIEELRPDVAVVDIEMPGLNGVELSFRLRETRPELKVLILSAHAEVSVVQESLRAGVAGFMLKAGAAVELVRAVHAVMAGETFFCPHVSTVLAEEMRRRGVEGGGGGGGPLSMLTERETDILRRVADGQATKEIAFALEISSRTIEAHRANLMTKLGIYTAAGLTKYALRHGLTTL